MKDCVFCKIVDGKLPSFKIYEDEFTLAFLDISKDVDGHILVIPKKHFKNILDCDEQTLSRIMTSVKKISNHLVDNCDFEGVNLLSASDECAGQSVGHFHIHIIPRKNGDGISAWPKFDGAKFELEEILKKLKKQ